ncbi:MAG: shikimate dehydrogenase [Candidatus Marinimicrobia bacterium]|nr:shikimate dehydrogenase [Candidatus Neomarinimicrobiota bacterium]
MKRFAIIGNPVAHSLSPDLHNWVFQRLSIDAEYRRQPVTVNEIKDFVLRLRQGKLRGLNVTLPLKQLVTTELDWLEFEAEKLGAVNCILWQDGKLKGYNTDIIGFRKTLMEAKINLAQRTCILLGAGGVARSVLAAVMDADPARIVIINRTPSHAYNLVNWAMAINNAIEITTATLMEAESVFTSDAVIINCTPVGMYPKVDTSPLPEHYLQQGQILIDTIYTPPLTRFLALGKNRGAQVIGGLDMFIEQALASLDIWFDRRISDEVQRTELKNYLIEITNQRS